MDLSETGPRAVTAAEYIAGMGCCVQKSLGWLSLELSDPRLGNVFSTLEEQPLKSSCQGHGGLWRVQVSGQWGSTAGPGCSSRQSRCNLVFE